MGSGRRGSWRPLAAALALTLLAYGGSLWGVRIFDDFHSVFRNPALKEDASLVRLLTDRATFSIYNKSDTHYRPLTLVSFALTFRFFGDSDVAFHAGNLLIHLSCVVALYFLLRTLLRRLGRKPAEVPAAVGAAVFGMHPAASQIVHYISSRSESLALAGVLGALALHAGAIVETSPRRRLAYRVLQASCVAVALGSKESGILALPLLIGLDLAMVPRPSVDLSRRLGRLTVPAALVLVYTFVELWPSLVRPVSAASPNAGSVASSPAWIVECLRATWVYLRAAVFPIELAFWRELPTSSFDRTAALAAGLLFAAALSFSTIQLLRGKARGPALAIFFFFVPFLPYLARPLTLPVNENRLYAPLTGLAVGASLIYAYAADRLSGHDRAGRRVLVAVVAILAIVATLRDWHVSYVWADEVRNWKNAASISPQSGDIRAGIGTALMRQQQWNEATEQFERALTMESEQLAVIHDNIGICAYMVGDVEKAHRYFRSAHAHAPNSIEILNNLGSVLHELGRPREALPYLDRAVALSPGYCGPRIAALLVTRTLGDLVDARRRLDVFPPHCRADPHIAEVEAWLAATSSERP